MRASFENGLTLHCAVQPPEGPVTLVELLPEVFTLGNAILEQAESATSASGLTITCAKGCAMCCRQLVAVSLHEAALLGHLVCQLQPDEQARIRDASAAICSRLEQEGLLAALIHSHTAEFTNASRLQELQRRYWALQLPCPFLLDEACSIYPLRPLLCREFLMTSPPAFCAEHVQAAASIRRVHLPMSLSSAVASFDGLHATPTRAVPLPLALTLQGLLEARNLPQAPAKVMLRALLEHAAEHFAYPAQP
ncbi:hypothetical protein JCM14635_24970 [Megalodesulfovibrio paquesii]